MKPLLPESFGISYQVLFTVRVLHRYFLDFGTTPFDTDAPSVEARKKIGLIRRVYDVAQFLAFLPDAPTLQLLKNQRMLFKKQADGFVVLAATENPRSPTPFLPLAAGLKFVFAVYPTDPFFMLYTNLTPEVMNDLKRPTRGFRLKNRNSSANPLENRLNTGETIRMADLEDLPPEHAVAGRLERPLGFIEIEHAPPTRSLLTAEDALQPTLTYTLMLQNRTTRWRLKNDAPGDFAGEHQMVKNGLIPAVNGNAKLVNPTPATTTFENDGHFYSTIY
ncbi:hypothetical protein [Larkinella punicea]|uniref:Uncharacterized protein n=1 Tax=Larkinella punicea TaxID=2315727 RepID=A0A368JPP8_9BACT|nr:hypothetical protein [Larkinella punicea]RCR69472.1 hypothetical protein DUE52_11515 [Larkinella punicea]